MSLPIALQSFSINDIHLQIFVPQPKAVQQLYAHNKPGAFWAQVWPASVGLCRFLQQHPQYISNKTVLELAAGLGLPGLYAARSAKQVCITDREQQAVDCIQQSAIHLQLSNVTAISMDWNEARRALLPQVLLLSDVHYEPAVFEELQKILQYFLQQKVTVIISTPQRLMAKQFINALLPYCTMQWNDNVFNDKENWISVFVLEQR
ncbi:MAG: class I SAM-dependent methyltransferase [Agriterribacter sp.]